MNRVRIATGQVALVSKFGSYRRTLTEGSYWLGFHEKIERHDMTQPLNSRFPLSLLLRDPILSEQLYVVEVADNEIALQYEDGNFKAVLRPGKHAFWKGLTVFSFVKIDLSVSEVPDNIDVNMLVKPVLSPYVRTFVIESYERGLFFRDGIFEREIGAGIYRFWKNAEAIVVLKADMRQLQLEVPGQEILTKDKAALRINFQAIYQIVDLKRALVDNKAYERSLYTSIQLALREFVGTLSLDELLEKKEDISPFILKALADKAEELGVSIKTCGIRDIILPGDVKEIMSRVLIAQKNAQANIITRREETASTRSLLNTAKLMEENEMLFKLKEMEYVEKIAEKINSISLSGGGQIVDQLKEIFSK